MEIAETAALCNFVIALIYSKFCFNTPAVKYKEEKTINIKALSTSVFLQVQFGGRWLKNQTNIRLVLLFSKRFLEAAGSR